MVVRDSTVPFHPVPKTRVIYELLKAFSKNIDSDGNFIVNDMWTIFKQLNTKNIISGTILKSSDFVIFPDEKSR